ncbi:MAG: 3-methyl-2-oxobutanoate hydroxymethyltransferase [Anaerolineales bacterium]
MSTQTPVDSTVKATPARRVSVLDLKRKKDQGEPIVMLTAYDYPTALAVDQAGIDVILVGDSLGMVVLGYETTLPVTMEDMLLHSKAVARGARHALLVGDLPFMSYQASTAEAVHNAGRFLQEGGMQAVKLEGGQERAETVRAILAAGIPVMGHLGLTPQSVSVFGGFKPQGRTLAAAKKLYQDALALQEAGCFSLVLESVPAELAGWLSQRLEIPTIGIGAGAQCDGQVLVLHDVLGLFERFTPKFVQRYAELHGEIVAALQAYREDVSARTFPGEAHTYAMPPDEWQDFLDEMEGV